MTLESFLNRLEKVKKLPSGEYRARCPAHEDKNPSLFIKDTPEKILIHDFAGCPAEKIVRAMGLEMKDLYHGGPDTKPRKKRKRRGGRKATYIRSKVSFKDKKGLGKPKFPTEYLTGPIKKYVKWAKENTEISPSFAFATFKNQLGLILGRDFVTEYGNRIHAPIFYDGLIGPTAFARKSTAIENAHQILSNATSIEGEPDEFITVPGIGSAEGLLSEIQGSKDKVKGNCGKVLTKLNEMALLTDKIKQTSTQRLISVYTDLWDLPTKISNPTLSNPITVKNPTVSLIAGSTVENIRAGLSERELVGGFFNRFCWWVTEETEPKPWVEPMPSKLKNELVKESKEIIEFGHSKKGKPLPWTEKAKDYYSLWYKDFRDKTKDSDRQAAVARIPEHVVRHALLFAAVNKHDKIDMVEIDHAREIGEYLKTSAYYAFERFVETGSQKLQNRVLSLLDKYALMRKSTLSQSCSGYLDSGIHELNQLLKDMEGLGWVEFFEFGPDNY